MHRNRLELVINLLKKQQKDKKAFKQNRQNSTNNASYHMDYKINPLTGVLFGHDPYQMVIHIKLFLISIFLHQRAKKLIFL